MDLRTYSKEMAERCRELARKLPEGRPPRSYLLQLAASYEEAAGEEPAEATAFAGAKPSLGGAEGEGAQPPSTPNDSEVRPVEASAEESSR